jgi:hypothetical protein
MLVVVNNIYISIIWVKTTETIRKMNSWGFTTARLTQNDGGNNECDMRRISMPMARYGHPYVVAGYGANAAVADREDGSEAWGACLGVLICVMLLLLLAFTASYPVSYYYYPSDPNMYRGSSYSYNHACPGCWL